MKITSQDSHYFQDSFSSFFMVLPCAKTTKLSLVASLWFYHEALLLILSLQVLRGTYCPSICKEKTLWKNQTLYTPPLLERVTGKWNNQITSSTTGDWSVLQEWGNHRAGPCWVTNFCLECLLLPRSSCGWILPNIPPRPKGCFHREAFFWPPQLSASLADYFLCHFPA